MPKPKAESWLTSAFYEGVTAYALESRPRPRPAYRGAQGRCWLAQHDERRRPCSGPFERFHFLRRQTVEDAVAQLLPNEPHYWEQGADYGLPATTIAELVLIAAWDPRNGEVGCELHHRRFDSHNTPPLILPRSALPQRVIDFAKERQISHLLDRFPL